jgi:hypothetical protein
MATETINPPATELFSLSARYLICPDSKPGELMNDASCLMASAIGVLDDGHEELSSAQWAALYLLRQAKAMYDEAQSALIKNGAIEN